MSAPCITILPSRRVPVESHFIIGQDATGHWLVLERRQLCGGLFKSRQNAIDFVQSETGRRPGAYEMSSEFLALRFDRDTKREDEASDGRKQRAPT